MIRVMFQQIPGELQKLPVAIAVMCDGQQRSAGVRGCLLQIIQKGIAGIGAALIGLCRWRGKDPEGTLFGKTGAARSGACGMKNRNMIVPLC